MTYEIIVEPEAVEDLQNIFEYIKKQDSQYKATNFLNELKKKIASLNTMPMRCRKSLYVEQENTRDLIYKGYTIVYQVRDVSVNILAIFRQKAF